MAGNANNSKPTAPKEIDVLFEDNHLLVINKPALLVTMGARPGEPSLVNLAKDYIRDKYQKPGNVYLGVVSRLDSFVSGVIVMARTSKAAARLNDQFRDKTADKTYLAIVPHHPNMKSHGMLEHWLAKDEANHRMMTVASGESDSKAKLARLTYEVIGHYQQNCLLKIKLETGRKHQIRVQLAATQCPIVGDRKYGSKAAFSVGIALHSRSLTIEHPTKREPMTFSAAPPRFWNVNGFQTEGNKS